MIGALTVHSVDPLITFTIELKEGIKKFGELNWTWLTMNSLKAGNHASLVTLLPMLTMPTTE